MKKKAEKKGGCPDMEGAPALCHSFLIFQEEMVMNPAQRVAGLNGLIPVNLLRQVVQAL